MLDDVRLKAEKVVNETKKVVADTLATVTDEAAVKPLEELLKCLEEVEGDLFVTELDRHIAELQAYQRRLHDIDESIDKEIPRLKQVSKKVESAVKAIGVVIDVASKVVTTV